MHALIHSFQTRHSLSIYLLSAYYMLHTVLDNGGAAVHKPSKSLSCRAYTAEEDATHSICKKCIWCQVVVSVMKQNSDWGGKCHVLYGSQGRQPELGTVEQISQGRLRRAQGRAGTKAV